MKSILVWCIMMIGLCAGQSYTNALVKENSPYLQQHAHNPVNWYPWGEEAFKKAAKEHKFIFLSIGYSTCHWCHEMEKESFTDETVAKLLNDDFVSIKVDREEYPQIDKKYQQLYMDYYGERGGWPLSVFMTPEGEVFHLGTYIPKEEGYGSRGLLKMLPDFAALKKDPTKLKRLTEGYKNVQTKGGSSQMLTRDLTKGLLVRTVDDIVKTYDPKNGGFADRPKFPEASKIALLLTIYRLNDDKRAYSMADTTLRKMALSGLYDQIGGGFFRYTTDREWQSPHFEKMLYTNAELIPVYVQMYEETKDPMYKRVVQETIAQMREHFMQEDLYFSASDADSDGEEGGYFIYNYDEVKDALLKKGLSISETEEALAYLGIEEDGNVDGELALPHITGSKEPSRLKEVKRYLKELRKTRSFPFVDTKIITAWNAMMVKALFVASRVDSEYLYDAKKSLGKLWMLMRRDGKLYHQTLYGKAPKQKAILEDYAFLTDALIEGYERSYDERYLSQAKILCEEAVEKFYRKGIWYLSDDRVRTVADFDDRYYTSAESVMLEALLKTAALSEKLKYLSIVKKTIEGQGGVLQSAPAKAAKLTELYLRLKKGDVIIHADRQMLLDAQKEIDSIGYPFVLSKVEQNDEYLACRINSCFAHDRNMTRLIQKIEEAVK
ncbi:thioredoxin domain-containing protein [Sulfurovum sp. NBC37-1]|uniref:thioredoxin domain-containing protein n=1 Tax=Sulfurovum sp. (strain NBC37-1) TaxID=387093 RepID=UPI0002E1E118|nr:thioredoxin domain-containing protein [Sulfurovum sp. NBC37-1]